MKMHLTKLFTGTLIGFAIAPSGAFAQTCENVFVGENGKAYISGANMSSNDSLLTSAEIDLAIENAPVAFVKDSHALSKKYLPELTLQFTKLVQAVSVGQNPDYVAFSVSPLANGNWMIIARGASQEWTNQIAEHLKNQPETLQLLKQTLGKHARSEVLARVDKRGRVSVAVNDTTTLLNLVPSLATNQMNAAPMVFQSKHAYPAFEQTLSVIRGGWDQRFPLSKFAPVGSENQFGTLIEGAQRLVGRTLTGIAVNVKRVLSKPLDIATIQEFSGEVVSVENINKDGIDPVWSADIKTSQGPIKVNLSEARGLRVTRTQGGADAALSGHEQEAMKSRRLEKEREFVAREAKPVPKELAATQSQRLRARIAKLTPKARAAFESLRARISAMLTGKPSADIPGGIKFLKRTTDDMAPRPLVKMKDESLRPLIEESQRMLYDTEGPYGFNNFLSDFAMEVFLDAQTKAPLKMGIRNVSFRDAHENYPFAEGMWGMTLENHEIKNIPLVTEADLVSVIDRRIHLYGFDAGIPKVPGLHFAPTSKYLATLEGLSLEDTTIFFKQYSMQNLLFQDTYFIGKPHGQYSHIFQWLYLAERLSHPEMNSLNANLLNPLMRVQPYFMDDFATGVRVTDFVGQRAPQNPDYINATLQLLFPVQ